MTSRLGFAFSLLLLLGLMILKNGNYFSSPVIELKGKAEVTIEAFGNYLDDGTTATLHNKDVSNRIKIKGKVNTEYTGTYSIEYVLYYKNKTYNATRYINVVDTVKPDLMLKGSEKLTINTEGSYIEPGYTAKDKYDGDISSSVVIKGKVNTKRAGTYTLTYNATDKSGNTASAIREVVVTKTPKNTGGAIYLTFDDGPSSTVTPKILDILKANNIKATFFLIDYSNENEHLVKRIYKEGHPWLFS